MIEHRTQSAESVKCVTFVSQANSSNCNSFGVRWAKRTELWFVTLEKFFEVDCRSRFSHLKTLTGSRPQKISVLTNHSFVLLAQRTPSVGLENYKAPSWSLGSS